MAAPLRPLFYALAAPFAVLLRLLLTSASVKEHLPLALLAVSRRRAWRKPANSGSLASGLAAPPVFAAGLAVGQCASTRCGCAPGRVEWDWGLFQTTP